MDNTVDEVAYHDRELSRLERELAAVVRQYRRATEVKDGVALEVETEALSNRIRWLLYNHLGLQIGMTSDHWIWLNGDDSCRIEPLLVPLELRVSGRFYCSLPEGHRQWTEPFAAYINQSPTGELDDYIVSLGNRVTLLNMPKVRELIAMGEKLSPPAPDHKDGWAFVFRKGDRA
jgi:hypothetical protein